MGKVGNTQGRHRGDRERADPGPLGGGDPTADRVTLEAPGEASGVDNLGKAKSANRSGEHALPVCGAASLSHGPKNFRISSNTSIRRSTSAAVL